MGSQALPRCKLSTRCLSSIAWSMSVMEIPDCPLRNAIAGAALRNRQLRARNLEHMYWSFSVLPCCNNPLRSAISAAALPLITEYNQWGLACTAWAISLIMFLHEPLLDSI